MLKYVDTRVCFAEIPDEVTLCINLSNCPCHCEGCHSPHLAEDIGKPLLFHTIENLLDENKGISAVCFMGGDAEPELVNRYARLIRESTVPVLEYEFVLEKDIIFPMKDMVLNKGEKVQVFRHIPNPIKIGWYSGRQELSEKINLENFDYIKLGPYLKEKGPLDNPNTNQRFYQVVNGELVDITHKFWKHETENQSKENT